MAEKKVKYYTVIAGNHKPQKQLQGFLKKSDGQPAPNAQEVYIAVGVIQVPNYSSVWARRVISNPTPEQELKMKNGSLSITDNEYKGELEFLPYGDERGESVEIRYLPNSSSLDKQYQDTILKLKPRDEDAFIDLGQGTNDFNYDTHGTLIKFLKVHGRNNDSPSRNPDIESFDFVEFSPKKVAFKEREKIVVLNTALNLVLNTEGNDDAIATLANITGYDWKRQPEELFVEMLEDARNEPAKFVGKYQEVKKGILTLLQNSVDIKLLDITQDGVMSFYEKEKKQVLLSDIPSSYKNKGMFSYVIENILDPEVYKAVGRLKNSFETAKNKV